MVLLIFLFRTFHFIDFGVFTLFYVGFFVFLLCYFVLFERELKVFKSYLCIERVNILFEVCKWLCVFCWIAVVVVCDGEFFGGWLSWRLG